MTGRGARGLTIHAALALGFGATVGLWLFAGYYFTERMTTVQHESAEVNRRYMQAQELLSAVRPQVLLGSVYVRDALLDPDPTSVARYRRQVQETYDTVDRMLREYVPILNSGEEQRRVAALRREIDQLQATLLEVLATDPRQWRSEARLFLGRIVGRRASVLQVSDEVQTLNRSAFIQQQQAIAAIYAATQRQVWQALGLALAASLGIAIGAIVYVLRLDRALQQEEAKELRTRTELQRLSTKLVTMQEEERRTIARELHDEIGQVLMAIKVELALAQRRVEAAGGPGRMLEAAQSITDGALHTVRNLSHLLHPPLLDDLGLPAALESHLAMFGKRHGLAVELLHEGMDERLVPEIELATYRIVQEALTNVAKHADATLAFVYVRRAGDRLQVSIEDNGVGFEPASVRDGLGLIGIRERVVALYGEVRLDSAPGKGTRLTIELPARIPSKVTDAGDSQDLEALRSVAKAEAAVG